MLKKRVVAALLAIGPVLYITWHGSVPFFLLILGISVLALAELYKLTKVDEGIFRLAGFSGNVLLLVVMHRLGVAAFFYSYIVYCFLVCFLWVLKYPRPFMTVAALAWGAFYVTVPMSFFLLLRNLDNGFWAVLAVLLTVWAADSAAFFCGLFLGKRKLAPRVSPNKTQEGALGGIMAGLAIMLLVSNSLGLSRAAGATMGAALALAGILGDLTESALKRAVNVKDSGTFLPGHGGVLDRIDSLLFAAPVAYMFFTMAQGGGM